MVANSIKLIGALLPLAMTEAHRDETGQFSSDHSDSEVVAAVRAHDPAATSEVAKELDISRQAADSRLRSLRDAGEVSSKKIGASLVWFMPRDRDAAQAGTPSG